MRVVSAAVMLICVSGCAGDPAHLDCERKLVPINHSGHVVARPLPSVDLADGSPAEKGRVAKQGDED